jgi:hypothetical protein
MHRRRRTLIVFGKRHGRIDQISHNRSIGNQFTSTQMHEATLLFGGAPYLIPNRPLVNVCDRFAEDSRLLAVPYAVASRVSRNAFELFVKAIRGDAIPVTRENSGDLSLLCE